MPVYYTGINMCGKKKQYEGFNARIGWIDFKDEEGNIIKNVQYRGQYNFDYARCYNPYACKYYHKGKKITFELNAGQFPFVE